MKAKFVVINNVDSKQINIIKEYLYPLVDVIYLKDVTIDERYKALECADVILSESFSSTEINKNELQKLSNLKLIQLIFSGADNVPFFNLPEHVVVASNIGAFAKPYSVNLRLDFITH